MPKCGRYFNISAHTALCPLWEALNRGVEPSLNASTFAPFCSKILTIWSCPICAAIHRGVAPSFLGTSQLAPADRSINRMLRWPFWAAMKQVDVRSFITWFTFAPWFISSFTTFTWPPWKFDCTVSRVIWDSFLLRILAVFWGFRSNLT